MPWFRVMVCFAPIASCPLSMAHKPFCICCLPNASATTMHRFGYQYHFEVPPPPLPASCPLKHRARMNIVSNPGALCRQPTARSKCVQYMPL